MIAVGLRGAPPLSGVSLRFLIAAALAAALLAMRRVPLPRDQRFLRLGIALGVLQVAAPYVLVYWAEERISSGLTAVLYSTMPLVVAIFARFLLGDRLTVTKFIGICAGIGGVAIIFSDRLTVGSSLGICFVLASVVFASIAAVITKKHARAYDPQALLFVSFLVGGVLALVIAVPLERSNPLRYDAVTWMSILYLAALGSVAAFSLFFWVLRHVEVTVVSYQTFVIPILAVLMGWLFLDETISARTGLGAALILAGIAVATYHASRSSSRRSS